MRLLNALLEDPILAIVLSVLVGSFIGLICTFAFGDNAEDNSFKGF